MLVLGVVFWELSTSLVLFLAPGTAYKILLEFDCSPFSLSLLHILNIQQTCPCVVCHKIMCGRLPEGWKVESERLFHAAVVLNDNSLPGAITWL